MKKFNIAIVSTMGFILCALANGVFAASAGAETAPDSHGTSRSYAPLLFQEGPLKIGGVEALDQKALDQYVAARAVALYDELNNSGRFRFNHPGEPKSTPSSLWHIKEVRVNPDSRPSAVLQFIGSTLSEGLVDLFQKGAVMECAIAAILVRQILYCELHGTSIFNKIYTQIHPVFILPHTPAINLGQTPDPSFPTKIGQWGYFSNVADYPTMHPWGNSLGENVWCVGVDQYVGFGELFARGPVSSAAIIDDLYRATLADLDEAISMADRKRQSIYSTRAVWDRMREKAQEITKNLAYHFDARLGRELRERLSI